MSTAEKNEYIRGESTFINPLDLDRLSPDQLDALNKLQQRFQDEIDQDERCCARNKIVVLRFLLARKCNLDNAERMLRRHIRYRQCLNLDYTAVEDTQWSETFLKYYPRGLFGEDQWGRPVVYVSLGGLDAKGLLSSERFRRLVNYNFLRLELRQQKLAAASRKHNRTIQQCIVIMDLNGLSMGHMWGPGVEAIQALFQLLEENSPEIVHKIFVINDSGWKEALQKCINPDQLPVHYGGTATDADGDPMCRSTINYGGKIPQEVYITEETIENLIPRNEIVLTKLSIPAGTNHLLRVNCNMDDAILFWYIEADKNAHLLNFGIFEIPESMNDYDDKKLKQQISEYRLPMVVLNFKCGFGVVPDWGHVRAKKCQYLFQFDNSYSWITSKHIRHHIFFDSADSETWKNYDMTP